MTLSASPINLLSLAALIKEQIVPLQLPGVIAAFQAGQTIVFGKLQVSRQGMALEKRQLTWSQIKSVRQEVNRLVIYDITRRKPWASVPITRVPNLFLLFALADYMRDVSSETFSQLEQDSGNPPPVNVQPLSPENTSRRTESLPNDRAKKRQLLITVQVLYLVVSGCLILFGFYHLPPPSLVAMPTPDIRATQVSLAQETSTVGAGNATAIALETVVPHMSPQAIYQKYTQGKPLFRDPLTSLDTTYFYEPDTLKPDPGCVFQKDGLHITSSEVESWIPCNNSAFPDLMNFSFQYTFSILKGDDAGLRFRALGTKSYYFSVNASGSYQFIYYPDVTNGNTAQTIQSGTTKSMYKGYGATNQLTLIAIGSLFYVYLNQQLVMKATDPTLTIGELSLLVDSEMAPTEAVFSQAVAWNIAGMAP